MKAHTDVITAQLGLPKYARFECITARMAIEPKYTAQQFAYKVYVGHDMIRAMLTIIDCKKTGEQQVRVENQTGSQWNWIGGKL